MPAEDIHTTAPAEAAGTEPVEPSRTHLRPVPDSETNTETAVKASYEQPDSAESHPNEDEGEAENAAPASSPLIDAVTWTRATFSPQSGMWSTRPLAPDEVIDRARRGSQLPSVGPLRTLSIGHGYFAAGVKIPMRLLDWVVDHQARTAVVTLLVGLLLYPPTRTAIAYLLLPAVWAHDLLT